MFTTVRGIRAVGSLILLVAFLACDSTPVPPDLSVLDSLGNEASIEAVAALLPKGDSAWAAPYGTSGAVGGVTISQLSGSFLLNGAFHELVWVHDPGRRRTGDPRADLNPVHFVGGKLQGWGWDYFDQVLSPLGFGIPVATGGSDESDR